MIPGRIQVPVTVKRGEVFQVRVLVHPMENGFRRELDGRAVAVNIVNKLACTYAGREVFRAELGTGVAANPYVAFFTRAVESGELAVEWSDDRGEKGRATAMVNVV